MFTKTVIRQGTKIIEQNRKIKKMKVQCNELNTENQELYEENRDIRFELQELKEYQRKTEEMKDSVIRNLFNLQDVSRLGISESEKDKHRNIIINHILKELAVPEKQY